MESRKAGRPVVEDSSRLRVARAEETQDENGMRICPFFTSSRNALIISFWPFPWKLCELRPDEERNSTRTKSSRIAVRPACEISTTSLGRLVREEVS